MTATYPILLGTAGHIDHGKTALVAALTGIDTDRLKVEKERGITTELGFAHLDAGDMRFGVVDVPGHERFIKSMVSGAGGLDLVCLVIAADEGVMPQTREHLDICQLLGVRRGLVALTKRDLVEDEWLELVTEDVREKLAGTFLDGAAIVPVSARTGAGLDALRDHIVGLAADLPARPADGVFRLPLDRVFTLRGFGTVVTGTALGGTLGAGDAVVVHPRGLETRVRGIQVHGEAADEARAGMRCALNLQNVATSDLARGDVLTRPGALVPSHIIDVRFRYLATSVEPLPRRAKVLFHHTTTQRTATLVLAGTERLEPGGEALAQIRLDAATPVAALPGDRFIARGFVVQEHYGTTIGGGEILRVHAPKARRSRPDEILQRIAEASEVERVALEVEGASFAGLDAAALRGRLGLAPARLAAILDELVGAGDLVRAGAGDAAVYLHAAPFARLEKRATTAVAAAGGDGRGMPREELRSRLPDALPARAFDALIAILVRRGAVEAEADVVRRPGAARTAALSAFEEQLARRFGAWGHTPPRPKEIPGEIGAGEREVRGALEALVAAGRVARVKSDLYVDAGALDALREKLEAHLDARGEITPAEWKQITGASRKYAIPLAEHFDAEKITLRVGDVRKRRG